MIRTILWAVLCGARIILASSRSCTASAAISNEIAPSTDALALLDGINWPPKYVIASSDVIWGISGSRIFQVNATVSGSSLTQTHTDEWSQSEPTFPALAFDGTFYVAGKSSLQSYNNEIPFDFSTPIIKTGHVLPDLHGDEHIVDITLASDPVELSVLVFITSHGRVGSTSLDFTKSVEFVEVQHSDIISSSHQEIEKLNHLFSITSDGAQGGVYAITPTGISRVQWDSFSGRLSLSWTAVCDGVFMSKPSFLGEGDVPAFVSIVVTYTDHTAKINVYRTGDGSLVSSHPIDFNNLLAKHPRSDSEKEVSSTEQHSVLSRAYQALVVSSKASTSSESTLCTDLLAALDDKSASHRQLCPILVGEYSSGLEQFDVDRESGSVQSVWRNSNVSCSPQSVVLSMSNVLDDKFVLYCVGRRMFTSKGVEGKSVSSQYSLEAVDWDTGTSLFSIPLGPSAQYNTLFSSPIQVNPEQPKEFFISTLAGIVRVFDIHCQDSPGSKEEADRRSLQLAMKPTAIEALDRIVERHATGEPLSMSFLKGIGFGSDIP